MKLSEARAKILLYSAKVLASGRHPVVLRVTFKRQRRYFSLPNINSAKETWDLGFSRLIGKGKVESNKEITRWEAKADAAIQTIKAKDQEFTFDRFERLLNGSLKNITLYGYLEAEIEQMRVDGRFSSRSVLKPVLSQLKKFHPRDMRFSDFDYRFLKGFETHLLLSCNMNGKAAYLRTLKAAYNKAVKEGYAHLETNPFKQIIIQKEATRKRALTKAQLAAIINHQLTEGTREFDSRQFYVFSYYCRGINFGDMALLKWNDNIHEDRICYVRSKTKKTGGSHFSIPIRGPILDIINYYRNRDPVGEYIFPILKPGYSLLQSKQRTNDRLKQLNADLKMLCATLEFASPEEVTFYSARHTWATVQKRAGSSTELIQEGLGHTNKVITETYLAQFEKEVLDKADEVVLSTGTSNQQQIQPFTYKYLLVP